MGNLTLFSHYLSQLLTTNVRKHKWNIRIFLFLYLKISITWIHESYEIKATFLCFSCFTIGFWSRCVFAQHTFISDSNINTRSLVFLLCFFLLITPSDSLGIRTVKHRTLYTLHMRHPRTKSFRHQSGALCILTMIWTRYIFATNAKGKRSNLIRSYSIVSARRSNFFHLILVVLFNLW